MLPPPKWMAFLPDRAVEAFAVADSTVDLMVSMLEAVQGKAGDAEVKSKRSWSQSG